MKKSTNNLAVIENFILHLTHSGGEGDEYFEKEMTLTPKQIYQMAKEYIEEDHVDGKGNLEDHIVTYGANSSYEHDDTEKKYEEHIVVVADFGDEVGTRTVVTIDNIENLQVINELLTFTANPSQGTLDSLDY